MTKDTVSVEQVTDADRATEKASAELWPYICNCPDLQGRVAAAHRIEATRQAEEQIKLLRGALEQVADARMAIDGGSIAECRRIARQALEATNG